MGAGGLGDIAIRYGHQRGITSVMWVTVVFLIILVQVVQLIFNWLSRRIDKRLDQPSGAKKSGPSSISCPALPIPSDPRPFSSFVSLKIRQAFEITIHKRYFIGGNET